MYFYITVICKDSNFVKLKYSHFETALRCVFSLSSSVIKSKKQDNYNTILLLSMGDFYILFVRFVRKTSFYV